jgi:hypothetical protein
VSQVCQKVEKVVFYGATRFEAPRLGHTFRRGADRKVLTIVDVKSEYIGDHSEDFCPQAWRFVAECRELTPEELGRFGRDEYLSRRSRN